jgi:hypothetical protein
VPRNLVRTLGITTTVVALAVAATLTAQSAASAANDHVSASTARAYPPGINLSLDANRDSVAVGQKVTLSAFHAGPGCSVKFTFGSQHAYRTASNGKAAATFTSEETSGTIHAKAVTYSCAYLESASTSVKASSPSIGTSGQLVKRHSFRVSISRFPPVSQIRIRVYNSHFSKTIFVQTGWKGRASGLFKVSKAGSYVVIASGHGAFASTVINVHSS